MFEKQWEDNLAEAEQGQPGGQARPDHDGTVAKLRA